ncbi:glycogen debranching N-terminal domain-containing protein [Streptomyces avermitilis]|uniref:glycogen debranching N-terminal domain-containing protein n=1 Tax=Streptomyces avermitilis TaxID=33903 RepID=UPI0037F6AFCF
MLSQDPRTPAGTSALRRRGDARGPPVAQPQYASDVRCPMTVPVSLRVGADFADVFAVKESRVRVVGEIAATPTGEALELVLHLGESLRGVRVESSDATARPDGLDFLAELPARGEWHTTVLVRPSVEGEEAGGLFHPGAEPGESGPARRLWAWRESAPRITDIEDPELHRTLRRSLEDLGALRIFDPRHPEHTAVAAGAPWFMGLWPCSVATRCCPRTWHCRGTLHTTVNASVKPWMVVVTAVRARARAGSAWQACRGAAPFVATQQRRGTTHG